MKPAQAYCARLNLSVINNEGKEPMRKERLEDMSVDEVHERIEKLEAATERSLAEVSFFSMTTGVLLCLAFVAGLVSLFGYLSILVMVTLLLMSGVSATLATVCFVRAVGAASIKIMLEDLVTTRSVQGDTWR